MPWYCCECDRGPFTLHNHDKCPDCGRDNHCDSSLDQPDSISHTCLQPVHGASMWERLGLMITRISGTLRTIRIHRNVTAGTCGSEPYFKRAEPDHQTTFVDSTIGVCTKHTDMEHTRTLSNFSRTTLSFFCFTISVLAALDAGGFASFCDSMEHHRGPTRTIKENTWYLDGNPIRHGLGPHHTVVSTIAFAISATALYHVHGHHQHQDLFFLGGIISGIIFGMSVVRDLAGALLRVMPWTILVALLSSVAFHEAALHFKCRSTARHAPGIAANVKGAVG